MRDLSKILSDVAGLADRGSELKQAVLRLVGEIERDHFPCDTATAWEIAFGVRPRFLAFYLKGLLEVLVDDVLDDFESSLRGSLGVTDADLLREWQERKRAERRAGFISSEEAFRGGGAAA
jgi:hypothetical protein